MKNLKKTAVLILCLMSFLGVKEVSAQEYEITIRVGDFKCNNGSITENNIFINGDMTVSVSANSELGVSRPLVDFSPGNGTVVFNRVSLMGAPRTVRLRTVFGQISQGQCDVNFGENAVINISPAVDDPGTEKTIDLPSGNGSTLQLFVTVTGGVLLPGSIESDQVVCEAETPEDITEKTPATGGAGMQYSWEYAVFENDVVIVEEDLDWVLLRGENGKNLSPPQTSESRLYRRKVSWSGRTAVTEPVEIKVYELDDKVYQFMFYLTDYQCDGETLTDLREVSLDFGEGALSTGPVGLSRDVTAIELPLTERPTSFDLVSSFYEDIGGDPVSCSGEITENNLAVPAENDVTLRGTITQGDQTLRYEIRITELPYFTLPGGEIEVDGSIEGKTICSGDGPIELLERHAADVEGGAYGWEFSFDGSSAWTPIVGATGKDLTIASLDSDGWYRRAVYQACTIGYSNALHIEVESVTVRILGLAGSYDFDAPLVTLTGTPSGGTFDGAGITGSTFNPSIAGAGAHTITYTYTSPLGCEFIASANVSVKDGALCTTVIPLNDTGEFKLDKFSGRIVYKRTDDCAPDIAMACFGIEPDVPPVTDVVSASAVSLSDEWNYSNYTEPRYETSLSGANAFELGELGKWRVKNSYVYRSNEVNRDKNYNTGTFNIEPFNWRYEDVNQREKWVPASSIVKYSPNGEALEEYNAIGISSTVKMGYYGALPYLTAQNAQYEAVFFESFELDYDNTLESGAIWSGLAVVNNENAHAGFKSMEMDHDEGISTSVMANANPDVDMQVQFWVKSDPGESFMVGLTAGSGHALTVTKPIEEIVRSGDWGLYQTTLGTEGYETFRIHIQFKGTDKVWVDDIRVQPIDSEMSCYVYDPATLRLMTVFDSQHFGLYYQYDGEGKLVRKMIETERGIRTVQETFYNTPKVDNTGAGGQ